MSWSKFSSMTKPLAVMKFGGTSVGDSAAIRKVVDIVGAAAAASELVVVVSAMSGVTNQLLEAARQAETGSREQVESIFCGLRDRHRAAIAELIHSVVQRGRVNLAVEHLFEEGERLCQGTSLLRELTPRVRDAISGLGERISAPLVAAVLSERGIASQSIEGTELIRTDSTHGAAEPDMAATRDLCQARLHPLMEKGIIPVVTGFIGATAEGTLTTLGRGGSDYSATILGAALDADEVTIWTDVDGLMTADPRLVPGASTIAEISYCEAAALARGGAKVLHPKTLSPVAASGIPIWIRNTFATENRGTRITPSGQATELAVKGLAVMGDAGGPAPAMVTVVGRNMRDPEVVGRILAALGRQRLSLISIPSGSSEHSFSFEVSTRALRDALDAVHREFSLDAVNLAPDSSENIPAAWNYTTPETATAD